MRILIAEDDRKLLKSLVHIFELNNYSADGVDMGMMPLILLFPVNTTDLFSTL